MSEEVTTLNEQTTIEEQYDKLTEEFKNRRYANVRMTLLDMAEQDIAFYIENYLTKAEQIAFFRILPKELASNIFIEFSSDIQQDLIRSFTDRELKAVLDDMFLDDTVDIIEEMPASVVKRMLKATDPEDRKSIDKLLRYPDDSAGTIMTPEFISLPRTMTVSNAFAKIRRQGIDKETIYTCYVCDERKKLLGVVSVKDLLLAQMNDIVGDIMDSNIISVHTNDDKEYCAQMLQKYDMLALPVIDNEGLIVGIITVDDAVDVIQEEATEDIQKMAAILPNDKPYLKTGVIKIWSNRIPWLLLLMVSATFTGLILNNYQANLSTVLIACVPMLMDTAGNAGGQSSVTVIRGIALKEIEFKDFFKVLLKEFLVGVICALVLGVVCFVKLQLVDRLLFKYDGYTVLVSLAVSATLAVTIIMAKLVGCMLPLFAKLVKLDPAVVASPFITTIVDALSLLVFVAFAGMFGV